jgi:hypothetical protein
MTPAERVILRVLAEEIENPTHSTFGYGPYGRASMRLSPGLGTWPASRVVEVEMTYVDGELGDAAKIREVLA